jgi:hypothetical protein
MFTSKFSQTHLATPTKAENPEKRASLSASSSPAVENKRKDSSAAPTCVYCHRRLAKAHLLSSSLCSLVCCRVFDMQERSYGFEDDKRSTCTPVIQRSFSARFAAVKEKSEWKGRYSTSLAEQVCTTRRWLCIHSCND